MQVPSVPPAESFQNDVLPNFNCYGADPESEWKAKNVAYAVAHLIEWVYTYYQHHDKSRLRGANNLNEFREMMFKECPDLKIVHMADAHKHRFLTRKPELRTVTSSTDAYIAHSGRLIVANGRYSDDMITNVVNFWGKWLGVHIPTR
jgi:hypothetical protein